VDDAGGLVPNSDGTPRRYDAVSWNCQHVLFWILSGTDLPPDTHRVDSGQIGLVADKARNAVKEGKAAAVAVADGVSRGVTATVNAAKHVAEKYPVQTVVTAAASAALVGLGIWYRSATRPRSASSTVDPNASPSPLASSPPGSPSIPMSSSSSSSSSSSISMATAPPARPVTPPLSRSK
jgi:hypothetical protein